MFIDDGADRATASACGSFRREGYWRILDGTLRQGIFFVTGSHRATVRFYSDGSITRKGFAMEAAALSKEEAEASQKKDGEWK